MTTTKKRIVSLFLALLIICTGFTARVTKLAASTGAVSINLARLGGSDTNNSANTTESQWRYTEYDKALLLFSPGGNYTLYGTHSDIGVNIANVGMINLTLDNARWGAPIWSAFFVNGNCNITLVGSNTIASNSHISGGFTINTGASCNISGTGSLTVSSGNYSFSALQLISGSNTMITGSATVKTIGGIGASGFLQQSEAILSLGDDATLITRNNGLFTDSFTIRKAGTATTHQWKLSNASVTSGKLSDDMITVAVASTKEATITRESTGSFALGDDKYTELIIRFSASALTDYYQVQRSTKKTSGFKTVGTTTNDYFLDYYLKAGTTYYYRIRPVKVVKDKNVYGKFGATIKATTAKLPVVNDVSVTAANKALNFRWDNNNKMAAIQIYYATTNTKKTKWSVVTVNRNDFVLRKLATNKKYFYKLRYVYINGSTSYGSFSSVKSIVTN